MSTPAYCFVFVAALSLARDFGLGRFLPTPLPLVCSSSVDGPAAACSPDVDVGRGTDADAMFAVGIDCATSSIESTADVTDGVIDGVTAKETDNGIKSTGLRTRRTRGLTAWYPSNTSSSEGSRGSLAMAATSEGAFDVDDSGMLVGSFAVAIAGIGWSAVASVVVWLGELTGVVDVSTAAAVEAFGLASSDVVPGDPGGARGDEVGSENPVGSNRKARLNTGGVGGVAGLTERGGGGEFAEDVADGGL